MPIESNSTLTFLATINFSKTQCKQPHCSRVIMVADYGHVRTDDGNISDVVRCSPVTVLPNAVSNNS